MRCDRFREAASARLDGEPIGMAVSALDHHLATCVQCARWVDEATRLTRAARLGSVDVPDLADAIVQAMALPAGRVLRRRRLLRWAVTLVGVVQLGLATPALFGTTIGMTMSVHAAHESAAWNAALGLALIACALQPRRALGVLAVIATFVGVLAILSIRDVASGAVDATRLASHASAVLGLGLVFALSRSEQALPPPGDQQPVRGSDQGGRRRLRGVA
ncbi:MAG: hypothetical protein JO147_04490 [Actinobacteria bacterium]|nr:hypothetical protein [Actinomycetota bacterium]